ncbi:MAG: hypothetical protein IH609_17645 [Dehalococcoidia bacterium]|nr:hypothetical protein [Dehalococcoidia bacterium]
MARPLARLYNHGMRFGPIQTAVAGRLAEAVALTPAARMATVETFFAASPRSSEGPFGLGRAILDFQEWEIASGRITPNGGGSGWWRAVNGMMVLDIAAATQGEGPGSPAVRAWLAYPSSGEPQHALWEAHQRSLHAGIRASGALLAAEPEAERRFAAIVIDVVDRTALSGAATDNDGLAHLTERYYPRVCPIGPGALPALEQMREKTAARLLDFGGNPFQDVGMDSSRWD